MNQAYVPPRNRRASQHTQARENVVPFPGAQAQQQTQPVQQPAQQQAPAAEQKKLSACVINVRNINDCRSAIGILRAGDCVIAVLDSIALAGADTEKVTFTVPADAKSGDTIHMVVEVTDDGAHNLKHYQRVVVTVA